MLYSLISSIAPSKVLFANKSQKPNKVVRPPEYTRRQDAIYFSPLGLQLADR